MRSPAEIQRDAGLVKGFLKPIFYDEYGRFSALAPDDFRKVRDGYACAKCLAEYRTYLACCPVCGHVRDIAADLEDPRAEHVGHLQERRRVEEESRREHVTRDGRLLGHDGRPVVGPRLASFDDVMADVNANPDIDHTSLSKLRPSRRGRK